MSGSLYNEKFYKSNRNSTIYSSELILNYIFKKINYVPNNVIDIGCGTGEWLNSAYKIGVKNITGADGKWVSGKDAQRPVWIVENTKESLKDTDFDKTFVAPEAATMVHLCIILAGMEGMVELQDACIQSVP